MTKKSTGGGFENSLVQALESILTAKTLTEAKEIAAEVLSFEIDDFLVTSVDEAMEEGLAFEDIDVHDIEDDEEALRQTITKW